MSRSWNRSRAVNARAVIRGGCTAGFSLIELMVALALGLLLSIGMVTLFGATGTTSKVQDALARLQENGRYAMTRMNDDLRMAGGQYCSNADSQGWTGSANNGPVYPGLTILANVNGVSNGVNGAFPDSNGLVGVPPSGWIAGTTYPIGPADFVRGYECPYSGGTCTPGVPEGTAPDGLPTVSHANAGRVSGTDVLTLRYQRGTGWPFTVVNITTPPTINVTPTMVGGQQLDDPLNFTAGDRALLLACGGGQAFQVSAAGNVLTPVNLQSLANYKPASFVGSFDVRVFNFTKDFVTVTYYVAYRDDPDRAGRLIPALYRRENGVDSELVQGVERLDFVYGVQYADATFHYLTAAEVNTNSNATNCSPASPGLGLPSGTVEAGCLWRSVKSIEAHMLLDTVNDIGLAPADMAYRYTIDSPNMIVPTNPAADMGNGMITGRMMRREFIALVAARNGNH